MSDAFEVGKKLVELVQKGNESQCLETLYSDTAISIEPTPGPTQRVEGIEAIKGKHAWWAANAEVHSSTATGPFPLEDRFSVIYEMDVTMKDSGERSQMKEVGLYTVKNGKIVLEEFMYPSGK